jgi:HPt (histidine-containing phosphotransfer) domain-containing protein
MSEKGLPPEIFAKLLLKYRESLPTRLNEIQEAIAALRKEATKEHLANLRLLIHKLAGNAGTYGFNRVTELCRAWDQRLAKTLDALPDCKLDAPLFAELDALLKQIREEFKG